MCAKKITIVASGGTEDALDDAITEAVRKIQEGCASGADRNDEGGYYFYSSDEVKPEEMPAS